MTYLIIFSLSAFISCLLTGIFLFNYFNSYKRKKLIDIDCKLKVNRAKIKFSNYISSELKILMPNKRVEALAFLNAHFDDIIQCDKSDLTYLEILINIEKMKIIQYHIIYMKHSHWGMGGEILEF